VTGARRTVAVVGGGQLGSRYLQGLAACRNPLDVAVVDPDPSSLDVCRSRWTQAGGAESDHRLSLTGSAVNLASQLDLAIISTTAGIRTTVVEELSGHARVGSWLLEKVLAQGLTELDRIAVAVGEDAAWVNTWARTTQWFRQIGAHLGSGPHAIEVTGGSWGLACNAIHFLDLVGWWTGEGLDIVDASKLDRPWLAARRTDHVELSGQLMARFDGGSTVGLSSSPPSSAGDPAGMDAPELMTIRSPVGTWRIEDPMSETLGLATDDAGLRIEGRIEYQSERTPGLVDAILDTGKCDLPDLASSIDLHRRFLTGLLEARPFLEGVPEDRVPIT